MLLAFCSSLFCNGILFLKSMASHVGSQSSRMWRFAEQIKTAIYVNIVLCTFFKNCISALLPCFAEKVYFRNQNNSLSERRSCHAYHGLGEYSFVIGWGAGTGQLHQMNVLVWLSAETFMLLPASLSVNKLSYTNSEYIGDNLYVCIFVVCINKCVASGLPCQTYMWCCWMQQKWRRLALCCISVCTWRTPSIATRISPVSSYSLFITVTFLASATPNSLGSFTVPQALIHMTPLPGLKVMPAVAHTDSASGAQTVTSSLYVTVRTELNGTLVQTN